MEVVDLDASPEDARRSASNPLHTVLTVPEHLIEREKSQVPRGDSTPQQHEANAVHRVTQKMLKKGNLLGAATGALLSKKDDGMTPEQREARRKEKLQKDAWCRKERVSFELVLAWRSEERG